MMTVILEGRLKFPDDADRSDAGDALLPAIMPQFDSQNEVV